MRSAGTVRRSAHWSNQQMLEEVHLPHLLEKPLARCRFLLFAHYAGLFIMLTLLELGKHTGFLDLLFEATQSHIEVVGIV